MREYDTSRKNFYKDGRWRIQSLTGLQNNLMQREIGGSVPAGTEKPKDKGKKGVKPGVVERVDIFDSIHTKRDYEEKEPVLGEESEKKGSGPVPGKESEKKTVQPTGSSKKSAV